MSYEPSDVYLNYFSAQKGTTQMHFLRGLSIGRWCAGIPYFNTKEEVEEFVKRVKETMERDAKNKQPLEYYTRVATLLHNMCPLLLKNKSLTEELLGSGLLQLCSYLTISAKSDKEIAQFEMRVALATSTSNPFHLIFEKYGKISAEQKEIISGILNLDYNEGRFWISDVSKACLEDLKNDVTKQVLMEFLKKI